MDQKTRGGDSGWEFEQTGSFADVDDADRKVLVGLIEMGSDLTKPRHSIHYFYFERKADADAAAAELEAIGFGVACCELLETKNGPRWPVKADRTEVINGDVIAALRGPLTELAERHGGDYDGWEAQVG